MVGTVWGKMLYGHASDCIARRIVEFFFPRDARLKAVKAKVAAAVSSCESVVEWVVRWSGWLRECMRMLVGDGFRVPGMLYNGR